MAFLPEAKTPDEIKRMSVVKVRPEYNKLAKIYNKIVNGDIRFCIDCGQPISKHGFYEDFRYGSGLNPVCKDCITRIVEQRTKNRDEPNITKESFKKGLEILNKPFIISLYNSCLENAVLDNGERSKRNAQAAYISQVSSLQQYRGKTWNDSDIEDDIGNDELPEEVVEAKINENSRLIKAGRKRFGDEQSINDIFYLETQYEDYVSRYEINLKSQEVLVEEICYKQLELKEARISHKETSKLLKDLQELMTSLNIKPSQSNSDQLTDAKSFGQLIDIQEKDKPIPEPEGPFKDIDHIAMLVDGFFRGHLAKMMGLVNGQSNIYDSLMDKFTVKKTADEDDEDDEDFLSRWFGSELNKELNEQT